MLHMILGPCGSGRSTLMTAQIREAIDAGRDVILLSPEQFSFEAERRLYRALDARRFDRLSPYSFATLAAHILGDLGSGQRSYATEPQKLVCLYEALRHTADEGLLTVLRQRSTSPEMVASMFTLVTKLRRAGVTAETLIDLAPAFNDWPGLSAKTADAGQILLAYDRALESHGLTDHLADLTEAAALAAASDRFKGKVFFIDEFDSFTGDQYAMLEVILEQAEDVIVSLRAPGIGAPRSEVFAGGASTRDGLLQMARDAGQDVKTTVLDGYRRTARPDLAAAALLAMQRPVPKTAYQGSVHIVRAADPEGEAEYIAAQICELLRRDETLRCSDIAILVKDMDTYAPLLRRSFERCALPCYLGTAKPVLHTDLVRFFLTTLDVIAAGTPDTDMILRYIKSPFSGYDMRQAGMTEHYCFTWSIDGQDWETPFWSEDAPDAGAPFGGQALEAMRASVMDEIASLRRRCRGASGAKLCEVLYRHLCEKREGYDAVLAKEDETVRRDHVMLWRLLCDILDTVHDLYADGEASLAELRETFLLLLRTSRFSVPPQTLDCLTIADAQTARLDAPRIVFVPGAIEGAFPGDVSDDGMFSQQELRLLEEQHIHLSRLLPELHADEMLILAKTFSAASEALYLTWPQSDAARQPASPAVVVTDIAALFTKDDAKDDDTAAAYGGDPDALLVDARRIGAAFYVRTPESAYYRFVRMLHEDDGQTAALRVLLEEDPTYGPRVRRLCAGPDEREASVPPETMQALLGDKLVLSASGIEQFYNCPFAYFCRYVLRLYTPEQLRLSATSIGTFAHYCLEHILLDFPPDVFVQLDETALRDHIAKMSADFGQSFFSDAVRRDERFRYNFHKTGEGVLTLLQQMQKTMRDARFQPVGYEVRFAVEPKEDELPAMRLADGKILIHGAIDRVDVCQTEDGPVMRVVDHKTGIKVLTPEKLASGLDMQMLVYLFALEQCGAYDGAKAAGVLYDPSGQPLPRHYQKRDGKLSSRDEILDAFYSMKGLILEDTAALMEPSIRGQLTPVFEHDDKDTLFSATDAQMSHLRRTVEQNICDMRKTLYAGKIAPRPYVHHDEKTACTYCGYADICSRAETKSTKLTADERAAALADAFGANDRKEDA